MHLPAVKSQKTTTLIPMPTKHVIGLLLVSLISVLGSPVSVRAAESSTGVIAGPQSVITNASAVRSLLPEEAAKRLPVRLHAVATYVFDTHSFVVQDESAGIFVGNGAELPVFAPGAIVEVEGVSGAGDFAPIVRPLSVKIVGHTGLPQPLRVTYEELLT